MKPTKEHIEELAKQIMLTIKTTCCDAHPKGGTLIYWEYVSTAINTILTRHFGQEEQPIPTKSVDTLADDAMCRIEGMSHFIHTTRGEVRAIIAGAIKEATAVETARADEFKKLNHETELELVRVSEVARTRVIEVAQLRMQLLAETKRADEAELVSKRSGCLLAERDTLQRQLREAQNITTFALDKDYYEKYQRFTAEHAIMERQLRELKAAGDKLAVNLDVHAITNWQEITKGIE